MKNNVKDIFVRFLMREGWTQEQAEMEYTFVNGKEQKEYIRTPRIGSSKVLGRYDKVFVYMTFENAQNHSMYQD